MGTTSETLSRALAKLRDQKFLRVTGNTVVVMRPGELQKLLQRNLDELWLFQSYAAPAITKKPVSPPPDVTLTTGEFASRTIAPHTLPENRNGFVSTNIG
jgi:hypothetical protein